MPERYVTVHRTYDPMQADILGQLLRENGIAARVLGTRHGAVIGVGQNILQLHIEVPGEQAGQATDFLESYFEADGAALLREEGVDVDDEDEDDERGAGDEARSRGVGPRRPLLAGGSVALIFGGGHFYSQRPWTALALAAGQLWAISLMLSSEWSTLMSGVATFAALLVLDFAGGQVAARAYNRGLRPSPWRQLAIGAAFVAIAGAVGSFIGPRIDPPQRDDTPSPYAPAHLYAPAD